MKNNEILNFISTILEPNLGLTIAEMGIKLNLNAEHIHLEVGFPCANLEKSLLENIKKSLNTQFPNNNFSITIEQKIQVHSTQLLGQSLRNVKNIIAIASGKGGVGKSTITVNLAIALAKSGGKIGILDADIYGPSIPLMLGEVKCVEIYQDKYLPVQAHGIQAMSIGYLMQNESALIWRGPMLAKSLIQMLDSTLWNDLDYLLIDLPPGTGDIQLSLVQKIPLSGAIIVTTPQQIATQDAQKAIQMFNKTGIDILGIVENMSQHICSNCGNIDPVFGSDAAKKLADDFNCQILGSIPLDKNIGIDCEQGVPTTNKGLTKLATYFNTIAEKAAIKLSNKPLSYANKFPPITVK